MNEILLAAVIKLNSFSIDYGVGLVVVQAMLGVVDDYLDWSFLTWSGCLLRGLRLPYFLFSIGAAADWEIALASVFKARPEAVTIGELCECVAELWAASQPAKCFTGDATFDALIATKDFCPGFLKYEAPNFCGFPTIGNLGKCPSLF